MCLEVYCIRETLDVAALILFLHFKHKNQVSIFKFSLKKFNNCENLKEAGYIASNF